MTDARIVELQKKHKHEMSELRAKIFLEREERRKKDFEIVCRALAIVVNAPFGNVSDTSPEALAGVLILLQKRVTANDGDLHSRLINAEQVLNDYATNRP